MHAAFALMLSLVVAGPTVEESRRPLTSVVRCGGFALASTPDGLFRASVETKTWERLATPEGMPFDGWFARRIESPLLVYVAGPGPFETDAKPNEGRRRGLYISDDVGVTWRLLLERDDLGAPLLLPDGSLFVVAGTDGFNGGDRILRTSDLGRTWREISGNGLQHVESLVPDPDHPGLVRAFGGGLRLYVYTAEDDAYQWKISPGLEVLRERGKHEFARDWSSSTLFFTYDATLANYFTYDFGESVSAPGLEILPAASRLTFSKGTPVVVPIRVVLHADSVPFQQPSAPSLRFADRAGEVDFWGARVQSAVGTQEKIPESRATHSTVRTTWTTPRLDHQVFDLTTASPYAREIDLGRIIDLSKPGEYRVQLVYNSGSHPDPDKKEWDGFFTSPVFTVVIGD